MVTESSASSTILSDGTPKLKLTLSKKCKYTGMNLQITKTLSTEIASVFFLNHPKGYLAMKGWELQISDRQAFASLCLNQD